MTAHQNQHLDDLAMRCIVFTDKNGKIVDKGSTGVSQWLSMEYKKAPWDISFRVQEHAQGNGSSNVKVFYDNKLVLEAVGQYIAKVHGAIASTYMPGDWEKEIPAYL